MKQSIELDDLVEWCARVGRVVGWCDDARYVRVVFALENGPAHCYAVNRLVKV